jgi:hypothetical protein
MSGKGGESGKKSKKTEYLSISSTGGFDNLRAALPGIIEGVLLRIDTELEPGSWNRLYFDLWLDSGRLILFPHKKGDPLSRHPLTVQIESPFLLQEYDSLPDPEEDETKFESYYIALEGRFLQCLSHALDTKLVKKALKKVRANHDFTLWYIERDDMESLVPLG